MFFLHERLDLSSKTNHSFRVASTIKELFFFPSKTILYLSSESSQVLFIADIIEGSIPEMKELIPTALGYCCCCLFLFSIKEGEKKSQKLNCVSHDVFL